MHKRATFLTIERPLEPQPPKDSEPYWCYINTLMFYDKRNNKVWEQKIPEARLAWMKRNRSDINCDDFEKYGSCQVFYDEHFGWQLRWTISHERAKLWHKEILEYIEDYHQEYHKNKHEEKARLIYLSLPE